MSIKRLATVVFDAVVCAVFITMSVLIFCGFYKAIGTDRHEAIQPVQIRTAPIKPVTVQPAPEAAVVEEIEPVTIEVEYVWSEPEKTYSEADLEMLALVIYQEAGMDACSDETRQMVGEVVLNRVADDRYPDTMEGVLTEVTEKGYGAYGRLHWTGIVWPERASYASEAHAVERAYSIAEKLLSGSVDRLLPEDTVFQAEFIQGTEVVAQHGGFYFCR